MKKYLIYVLYSDSHKQLYIGHTNDLKRRFKQHNKGKVSSTKPYRPYRIIYSEEAVSKTIAVKREKVLKLTKGRQFLKQFI
jgi:putative endonuclease